MHYDQIHACISAQLQASGTAAALRIDAGETAMFARSLEYIMTEAINVEYPDNKAMTFLPVLTAVDPGADSYTYRQHDYFGKAKIVHDMARDFPNVELIGAEITNKVRDIGVSYQYSIMDLRKAALAGRNGGPVFNIDLEKASTARRAVDNLVETIAATGDANSGLNGLLNFSTGGASIPAVTASTKAATGTAWYTASTKVANATPTEIMNDINALSASVFDSTQGIHTMNTLLVDSKTYSFLATTQVAPAYGADTTLLQYILRSSPWIKTIDYWLKLDSGFTGGFSRIIGYDRNPAVLQLVMPQMFEQFAPQQRGMAFVVYCHARCGGVTVRFPKALATMDSIQK